MSWPYGREKRVIAHAGCESGYRFASEIRFQRHTHTQ